MLMRNLISRNLFENDDLINENEISEDMGRNWRNC